MTNEPIILFFRFLTAYIFGPRSFLTAAPRVVIVYAGTLFTEVAWL